MSLALIERISFRVKNIPGRDEPGGDGFNYVVKLRIFPIQTYTELFKCVDCWRLFLDKDQRRNGDRSRHNRRIGKRLVPAKLIDPTADQRIDQHVAKRVPPIRRARPRAACYGVCRRSRIDRFDRLSTILHKFMRNMNNFCTFFPFQPRK